MGSVLLDLDRTLFDSPFGPVSGAKFLQYIGHTVGSLIGVLLFVLVVSRRHLGEWYGIESIEKARSAPVRSSAGKRAIAILTVSIGIGAWWGSTVEAFPIFYVGFTFVIGLLVTGIVNRPDPKVEVAPERLVQSPLQA